MSDEPPLKNSKEDNVLDLIGNVQLKDYLTNNHQDWCQHVAHRVMFGNHLDVIEIVSTYQITLSVAAIRAVSGTANYQNNISAGMSAQVLLPITTRCKNEMLVIDVKDSQNCTAFVDRATVDTKGCGFTNSIEVHAVVPIGQTFSISIIEKRLWKRKAIALGRESTEVKIPQDGAKTSTISIISLQDNVVIQSPRTQNLCNVRRSSGIVTASHNFGEICSHSVSLVLAVRSYFLILMMHLALLMLAVIAFIEPFAFGRLLNDEYNLAESLAIPTAGFGLTFTMWRYFRRNAFEASFFRFRRP